MEIGSAGEWVAAVASVIAVGAAIAAGLYAKRTFDLERDREDRARRSIRQGQASRFAAWAGGCDRGGRSLYGVVIANGSDSLVYDVRVTLRGPKGFLQHTELTFVPPGRFFWVPNDVDYKFPQEVTDDFRPDAVMSTSKYSVDVSFTDAKNERWTRAAGTPLEWAGTSDDGSA
jgi:hypothetical protein